MRNLFLLSFLVIFFNSYSEVKLPQIFSDNMVIQRDKPIVIWGWANAGEKVEIQFKGAKSKTTADKNGNWKVTLRASAFGGPFTLNVKGKSNNITFKNVLVGDVWVCSGQSNMEWPLESANNALDEIANAKYPNIRLFTVTKAMNNKPEADFQGTWSECSPETAPSFSAVGYFFGRELHRDLNIPIGLINSSWGGTDIETWTSKEMMESLPEFHNIIKESQEGDFKAIQEENARKRAAFDKAIENDRGLTEQWQNKTHLFTNKMKVPGNWDSQGLSNMDGSVWFSFDFNIPDAQGKPAKLSLGAIDDKDITWINGTQVGTTNSYSQKRLYEIPAGILKNGKNTIVVNVVDFTGGGGLYSEPEAVYIEVAGRKYPLGGEWNYAISVDSRDFGGRNLGPNSYPSLLFNAMIAPITQFPICGAIWYQGENNAYNPKLYQTLFPNMINDWRTKWNDQFPFYWVNLANYMAADIQPSDSNWSELREAQSMTLSLPKTGEALAIDLGDATDIHPRNKQDVGRRLALNALKYHYGKSVIASGPVFKSAQVENDHIVLTFSNIEGGLTAHDRYGYVRGFAIAGEDGQFVWAQARIEGDKVIVFSDKVKQPRHVRYAWGNNPDDANLYNGAGLPTTPFRSGK